MTIKELSRYREIEKQIREIERRIVLLREKAASTTQKLTAVPGGGTVSDKVGNNASNIVYEISELKKLELCRKKEYRRLSSYISSVEDIHIQRIMQLRFIDGYKWSKVAIEIGGCNSATGVYMAVRRYVEKIR